MGQFKEMTLEQKSYVFGLLLTDGTLHLKNEKTYSGQVSLELSEKDEDIVDKLCEVIPNSTKTKRSRNTNFKQEYNSVKFSNSRQIFIKELIEFGFPTESKTINARPPIVEYDKDAFWRGVIDGDGSVGIRKTSPHSTEAFVSLTTKSETLKNEFNAYIAAITGKQYNFKRNKRDDVYNLTFAGFNACKILNSIYKNSTIHLDRKYQKYLDCLAWKEENLTPKRNTSGVVGVGIDRTRNIWMSYITINKQNINLGYYVDKNDAIIARLKAEREYFGEFAKQKHLFKQYELE